MIFALAAAVTSVVAGPFVCTPTAVYDGDGPIWCAEGPHVRLSGIAARELDGTCRRYHPCPRASGKASRDQLVRLLGGARGTLATGHILVRGPTMRCVGFGGATGDRTAALCMLPGVGDLSCAMIHSGTVAPWPRYRIDPGCHYARRADAQSAR